MRVFLTVFLLAVAVAAGLVLAPSAERRLEEIFRPLPAIGVRSLIPPEEVISAGTPRDGIPALSNPKFVTVGEAAKFLDDEKSGILLTIGEVVRYYPFQILVWHEIVNDNVEGVPLLVTHCPLCGSGKVYERRVRGEVMEFGSSGKIYNSDTLIYNRGTPESLWTEYDGRAVIGDLAGTELAVIPSTVITWRAARENFPGAEILSNDTGYPRNYKRDPYGDYYLTDDILFEVAGPTRTELPPKTRIVGIIFDGSATAYTKASLADTHLVADELAGRPIIITHDPRTLAVYAFSRQFMGEILDFDFASGSSSMVDRQSGTRWSLSGEGLEGKYAGRSLNPVPFTESYWFVWAAFHPQTVLSQ